MGKTKGVSKQARQLHELAHQLAWDNATVLIDSYSVTVKEDGETWHEIRRRDSLADPAIAQSLRYLELRGALVRHRHHRNWVQIGEPAPVACTEVGA